MALGRINRLPPSATPPTYVVNKKQARLRRARKQQQQQRNQNNNQGKWNARRENHRRRARLSPIPRFWFAYVHLARVCQFHVILTRGNSIHNTRVRSALRKTEAKISHSTLSFFLLLSSALFFFFSRGENFFVCSCRESRLLVFLLLVFCFDPPSPFISPR